MKMTQFFKHHEFERSHEFRIIYIYNSIQYFQVLKSNIKLKNIKNLNKYIFKFIFLLVLNISYIFINKDLVNIIRFYYHYLKNILQIYCNIF